MKKLSILIISTFILAVSGMFYFIKHQLNDEQAIYLHPHDTEAYHELALLKKFIEKNHRSAHLSDIGKFKSGKYNLYTASDIKHLPTIIDDNAINILWIDVLEDNEKVEPLRPFDVIVVKGMPAFSFLKAINVRTAYIPHAINIQQTKSPAILKTAMYYGDDGNIPSLTSYLIKNNDINLDIYGKNFANIFPKKNIVKETPEQTDFIQYSFVLTDQEDNDIKNELLNKQVIQIIESGGLPYVRYNPGIEKIFGDIIPMYHNEKEFVSFYNWLRYSPNISKQRLAMLQIKSEQWNSDNQAKKFIELFDVMQKKLLLPFK